MYRLNGPVPYLPVAARGHDTRHGKINQSTITCSSTRGKDETKAQEKITEGTGRSRKRKRPSRCTRRAWGAKYVCLCCARLGECTHQKTVNIKNLATFDTGGQKTQAWSSLLVSSSNCRQTNFVSVPPLGGNEGIYQYQPQLSSSSADNDSSNNDDDDNDDDTRAAPRTSARDAILLSHERGHRHPGLLAQPVRLLRVHGEQLVHKAPCPGGY